MDTWQSLVLHWQFRIMAVIGVCTVGFVLGIPCTTQGGMYVLQLMDHYSAGFCVLVIAVVECFVINWVYGADKMCLHIEAMTGRRVHVVWKICWQFISPILIVLILIFSFVRYKPVEYGSRFYPVWADVIGWILTLASNIPIFIVAAIMYCKASGSTVSQKLKCVTAPMIEPDSRRAEDGHQFDMTTELGHDGGGLDLAISPLAASANLAMASHPVVVRTTQDGGISMTCLSNRDVDIGSGQADDL
jgi:solute carrier family 6 amino acid transporter-like protein 5/7/9/14